MITFKFVSRKEKSGAVVLRITSNRKTSELSMGFPMDSGLLDEILSGVCAKEYMEYRNILTFYQRVAEDVKAQFTLENRQENVSAVEFRDAVKKEAAARRGLQCEQKQGNFIKFYRKRMDAKANAGYKASIEYTLNKIIAFCKDKEHGCGKDSDSLVFDDISLKWLNAFDEWLMRQGAAQNTRNIHFRNIRTVINRAIDEELTEKYPFRRFKIRPEATRKRSLSFEGLRKLFDHPAEEYQKFYLDMFRLMFYLCGINSTDLYNLTDITDGRVEYRRAKTHRLYSIKVEPEAMEIINRWKGEKKLLCIADRWSNPNDFNKNMNIALKKIGKQDKMPGRGGKIKVEPLFPELSTYWARHTWATIAASLDIPKDTIAHALGHGNNTVTDIYIDFDISKVDKANRKVLDWVLLGKKD